MPIKIKILPKTKLGKWSIGLIIAMPILFYIGMSLVDAYEGISSGRTILKDVVSRPGVALPMLTGFAVGILAFITGLISIVKKQERAVLVFLSSSIGALLILFLTTEIIFSH